MEQEILEEGLDLELLKIEKELAKIPANLTGYINTNLVTIISIINKYPRNSKMKIDYSKLTEEVELSDTAYETLIKYLKTKFPNHSLSRSTLSATITRVKKRKGLIVEREKKLPKQVDVIVNSIVKNEEPIIKKLPQKQDNKLPSVEVLNKNTKKESQSAMQIDKVSSEQVQSNNFILTEEDEQTVLNSAKEYTYFNYKKFIDKLDQGVITDKSYGIHEEEINMEKLVKVIYKMFEMEFPGTDIGILADGQKRSMKIENSKLNPAIKKMASQLWARNDLINMLIGRKNRQS